MSEQPPQAATSTDSEPTGEGASGAESVGTPSPAAAPKHAFLLYSLIRIGLFLAFTALVFLFVHHVLIAALFGALLSGIVSFFLLNKLRDRASQAVAPKLDDVKQRMQARRDAEDAAVDALRAEEARARGEGPSVGDDLVD